MMMFYICFGVFLIKLFLSYLLGGAASGVIMILSTFCMTRLLLPEAYGLGMFFVTAINLSFYICNMGMDQVLVRYFYEPEYKSNTALLLYRCLAIVLVGFVLFVCMMQVFQAKVLGWLSTTDARVIPALLAATALFICNRFLQLIPRLKEEAKYFNLANGLAQLMFLISFIVLFYGGLTSYWVVIDSQLIAFASSVLLLFGLYRKVLYMPFNKLSSVISRKAFKAFLQYGTPSLFSLGLTWLFVNLDKLFILHWSGSDELGIYTAAFALTAPLLFVQSIFNTAWAPRMTQMLVERPFKSRAIFVTTFERLNVGLFLLFLVLVLLKPLLVLFLGEGYRAAATIFPWLLFAPYFRTLSEVVFAGIVKSKKSYWNIVFSLAAVIVNVASCYVLIPRFGGVGAAVSVALSFMTFFVARWVVAFRYYAFRISVGKSLGYIAMMVAFVLVGDSIMLKWSCFFVLVSSAIIMERAWLVDVLARYVARVFAPLPQR
jgi:O-antigen/teichoic acid export membrane protein